jgi:hypothetical protein
MCYCKLIDLHIKKCIALLECCRVNDIEDIRYVDTYDEPTFGALGYNDDVLDAIVTEVQKHTTTYKIEHDQGGVIFSRNF